MKKIILLLSFAVISATLFNGCSKEDDTLAPVITLNGDNPFVISSIGGTYTEPGYTCTDDQDGNITSSVNVNNSELNVDSTGTYEIHYEVSDAAGNAADVHRQVIVKNAADALAGTYGVLIQQTGFADYNYSEGLGMSATVNNKVIFGKFGNYTGAENKVYANVTQVSGTFINITIPTQTVNCGTPAANRTFSGFGTISISGSTTTFVINVTESITGSSPVTSLYTYTK